MENSSSQRAQKDRFDLNRFVEAQTGIYEQALAELKRGQKESHWMWFIFPQIDGLGRSSTARFYAIKSAAEAKAYLDHPALGKRLIECSSALLPRKGKSASDIFGFPDDLKLKSSMTLFARVAESDSVFSRVLDAYFGGDLDQRTIEIVLGSESRL
jgi:uncharacterized protein (DUF1810 family)